MKDKFPCGSCGKLVAPNEYHPYEHCLDYLAEQWYPVAALRGQAAAQDMEMEALRERLAEVEGERDSARRTNDFLIDLAEKKNAAEAERVKRLEKVEEAAWALVQGTEWPWGGSYEPAAGLVDALAALGGAE